MVHLCGVLPSRCDSHVHGHPIPAYIDTSVTLAPAELGAFSVIRYAAIRTALVPSAMNWFDDPRQHGERRR